MDRRKFLVVATGFSAGTVLAFGGERFLRAEPAQLPAPVIIQKEEPPLIAKLSEVAIHCQNLCAAKPGLSLAAAVREFLAVYTKKYDPATTSGYYSQYTRPKNWDVVMTDLWKCAASDPTQRNPEVLCFDVTNIMIMILAVLGVPARSVRLIATNSLWVESGTPVYLDHTLVEVFIAGAVKRWSIQDAFFNYECLNQDGSYASVDDVCGANHLDDIKVRNEALRATPDGCGGFSHVGAIGLAVQDFFAAVEHRDAGGGTAVIANGQDVTFPSATSTLFFNGHRADFDRIYKNPNNGQLLPLRQMIIGSTLHPAPLVSEVRPAA